MYRIFIALVRGIIEKAKQMRLSQIEEFEVPPGRVLFIGDSITELGMWSEWFPELHTLNRGVGSDTVSGVSARLGHAINAPVAISLLIGTNDLTGLGPSRKVDDIAAQMRNLVAQIREHAPDTPLIINSVMPRQRSFAQRVRALNDHYRSIAADAGAVYLDLWPALAGPDDAIRSQLSRDGVHLTGPGYRAWVELLRPILSDVAAPSAG